MDAWGGPAAAPTTAIGGIAPLEPGYRRVLIAPQPGGGITWASAGLDTVHGPVSSSWRTDDVGLTVDVVLPPGTTGVVRLPGHADTEVTGSARVFRRTNPQQRSEGARA